MKKISQLLFIQDQSVLMGFRQNVEVENERWGFPGGKVETGESFEEAAAREAFEEVGVRPVSLKLLFQLKDRYGYEHAFFECRQWEGTLRNAEPHLCGELAWFAIFELPSNCSPISYVAADRYCSGELAEKPKN